MIKIYNTLKKKIEELKPQKDGSASRQINMFVCGPTVYDYIHIGNARTFVIFDAFAKYLRYRDFQVNYIQNITDIDDKIITRATAAGTDPIGLARDYEAKFKADMKALGVTAPDQYLRATDYIQEILAQVKTLITKKHVYFIEDEGYYFDLTTFKDYGKLSGRTTAMADDGVTRIDESDKKRNRGDFCVWKLSKPGEPKWPSDLGAGRPGWHIEDTAITEAVFGPQYDLHGGGQDLIFPHHEAEIAQQEAASDQKPFVRYWMHAGFLVNSTQKMSKSLGNFTTAHEVLGEYSPQTLRLYFLSGHWHSPLDYNNKSLEQAQAGIDRVVEFLDRLHAMEEAEPLPKAVDQKIADFIDSQHKKALEVLDDNFNTPEALAVLFETVTFANKQLDKKLIDLHSVKKILEFFDLYDSVLGVIPHYRVVIPEKVQRFLDERQGAKDAKDFRRADLLRSQIMALGFQVDDTPQGQRIKKR